MTVDQLEHLDPLPGVTIDIGGSHLWLDGTCFPACLVRMPDEAAGIVWGGYSGFGLNRFPDRPTGPGYELWVPLENGALVEVTVTTGGNLCLALYLGTVHPFHDPGDPGAHGSLLLDIGMCTPAGGDWDPPVIERHDRYANGRRLPRRPDWEWPAAEPWWAAEHLHRLAGMATRLDRTAPRAILLPLKEGRWTPPPPRAR